MSPVTNPTGTHRKSQTNKLSKSAKRRLYKQKHHLADYKIPKKHQGARATVPGKQLPLNKPTRRERNLKKHSQDSFEAGIRNINQTFGSDLQHNIIKGLPDQSLLPGRISFLQEEQAHFQKQVKKGFCFLLLRNADSNKIWVHSHSQLVQTFGTEGIYFQNFCEGTRSGYSKCNCCIRVGIKEEEKNKLLQGAIDHPEEFPNPQKPIIGHEQDVLFPYTCGGTNICKSLFPETKDQKGFPRVSLCHTLDNNGRLREHHLLLLDPEDNDLDKPALIGRTLSDIADTYPYPVDSYTTKPPYYTIQYPPYCFKYSQPTAVHQEDPKYGDLIELPYFPHYTNLQPDHLIFIFDPTTHSPP